MDGPDGQHQGAGPADADGPPPPPWERRRRRRRRAVSIVAVVALLVLVPLGLVWAGVFDRPTDGAASPPSEPPTDPTAPTSPTAPDDPDAPDPGIAPDLELDPPDPDDFTGSDADFARLLAGVEASERVMLGFQRDLGQAFELARPDDLGPLFAAVREVAEENAERLSAARADLEEELDTPAAETVRTVYLDHLDAWLGLMQAAAEDPTILGPDGNTDRFDVAINATAVDFSRSLERELPEDAAEEIARFAQELLDRGFRFDDDAQV